MKSLEFKKFPELNYTLKEQFLSLNINLEFCGDDIKVISVTSSQENEGKSFVSMQLLRSAAMSGKKVLLIDADLRKSRIVREYGVKTNDDFVGLSHYLAGKAELEDVIFKTNIENAHVILAGKCVSNPVNLFKKNKFDDMLEILKEYYDLIIMDTPPIEPVIDGALLAPKCDGILLVINYGKVSVYEVQDVINQLNSAHATILGAVLNKVPFNIGKYYYKSSKYYSKYKQYRRYGYGSYNYGYGYYGVPSHGDRGGHNMGVPPVYGASSMAYTTYGYNKYSDYTYGGEQVMPTGLENNKNND